MSVVDKLQYTLDVIYLKIRITKCSNWPKLFPFFPAGINIL